MTYANFKQSVLDYVNRTSTVFTSSTSIDYVLQAMNDARRAAQREYTFNLLRRQAFAQVSIAPTSLLTDFDADPTGSGALVIVKQVDAVFEYGTASVGGASKYYRTNKIPCYRHSQFEVELEYSSTVYGGVATTTVGTLATAKQWVYLQGSNVYHSSLTTAAWLMFDVVEFMADHAGGSSTVEDIWLTYFLDWLKYATIMNLNQFLKDTERLPVDNKYYLDLWKSVKQFDSQLSVAGTSMNLD